MAQKLLPFPLHYRPIRRITREIGVRERREHAHEERAPSSLFAPFLNPLLFLVSLVFPSSIRQFSVKFPREFFRYLN